MKKMILTASLLSMFVFTPLVWAVEEHHPETQEQAAPAAAQLDAEKMDASVLRMQEMRKKIETEENPAARKGLMRQHMRMMRDGMNMMSMMGDRGGMMAGKDTSAMPMADRMKMMEKMMMSMQKMMVHGGGMKSCGMMGGGMTGCGMMGGGMAGCGMKSGGMMGGGMMGSGMMGGASGKPKDGRIDSMEKRMMMMQETINGMMMQQELMTK